MSDCTKRNFVRVENRTFELSDSNGNIYLTETDSECQTFGKDKGSSGIFGENLFGKTFHANADSRNQFDNGVKSTINVGISPSAAHSNMEPIIIDDYHHKMNSYFTQAASNVTIYLNPFNEKNFVEDSKTGLPSEVEKFYQVDSNGVIDLTKHSDSSFEDELQRCSKKKSLETSHVDQPHNFLNIGLRNVFPYIDTNNAVINNVNDQDQSNEQDVPDLIDISKLEIKQDFCNFAHVPIKTKKGNYQVPPFLKRNRQSKAKLTTTMTSEEQPKRHNSDDEVIFVGEFNAEAVEDNLESKACDGSAIPLDLRSSKSSRNRYQQPRRNPKRKVQLLKESYALAVKLSDADIYYGRTREEYYMENVRKSVKNDASVLNSSSKVGDEEWKEWPTDGMHERPVYNTSTKKVEKFDYVKKKDEKTSKSTVVRQPTRRGHRRRKATRKTNQNSPKSKGNIASKDDTKCSEKINEEFAALTHDTLLLAVDYVIAVKEFNQIKNQVAKKFAEEQTEQKSLVNEMLSEEIVEQNVKDAGDLLADTCILYSIANNIKQQSVADYLCSFVNKQNIIEKIVSNSITEPN